MKRIIGISLMLLIGYNLQGQKYITMYSAVNFCKPIGYDSETFKYKRGFIAGAGYHNLFSNPFSIGVELAINSKGYSNSYSNTIKVPPSIIKEFYYSNNVNQINLHLPFVLTYHSKWYSLDFGPYFEFKLYREQVEDELTIFKYFNGEVISNTQQFFYNRQELKDRELGIRMGLNLNIIKNASINFRYLQSLTPLGKDYNWQRLKIYQLGLSLNIGKNFTSNKLSKVQKKDDILKYSRTISANNIIKVDYKFLGEGNTVSLKLRTVDKNSYVLLDMMIYNSSGDLRQSHNSNTVFNVNFPFNANLRFKYEDPNTKQIVDYFLEFEILKSGKWEVIITY